MEGDAEDVVLLEGWLLRESTFVGHVVNRRYAVLRPRELITYRRKGDASTAKSWHLNRRARVDPPGKKMFNQIKGGNEKSLWAAISSQSVPELLHYVTVSTPHGAATLAFLNSEECGKWFTTLAAAVETLQQQHAMWPSEASTSSMAVTPRITGSGDLHYPIIPHVYQQGDPHLPSGMAAKQALAATTYHDALRTLRKTSGSDSVHHLPDEGDAAVGGNPERLLTSNSAKEMHLERRKLRRKWKPYTYVNGVSVFLENSGTADTAGANPSFMTSIVVRAPPVLCVQEALAKGLAEDVIDADPEATVGIGGDAPDSCQRDICGAAILEHPDQYTDVLVETWQPPSWLAFLVARRELVMRRSWRKEADGTHVMVYSSTTHKSVPLIQDVRWWQWLSPIRAHAEAGLTFSPQLPAYTHNSASTECLVTQVVKVDLGGWLGNPGARTRRFFLPALFTFGGTFLSRVVRSAVVLREQVEYELFVARPFAMGEPPGPQDTGHLTDLEPRSATFYINRAQTTAASVLRNIGSGELKKTIPRGHISSSTPAAGEAANDEGGPAQERNAADSDDATDTYCPTGTLDRRFWSCPGPAGYKLRAGNYLKDHKKVAAGEPAFNLASVDLVSTDKPCFHIAHHLPAIKHSDSPFTFVVNIMVPASPPLHLCAAWAMDSPPKLARSSSILASEPDSNFGGTGAGVDPDSDAEADKASPFDVALARFLAGGDGAEATAHRNGAFKLIPHIVQGSWIVKQSVGETPVLLGKKLTTHYFKGPNYFEVDIDVSSSSVAKHVVGLVCGATKAITVDMAILLQGNEADELPECLLGTLRLAQIDLSVASHLDVQTGKITSK